MSVLTKNSMQFAILIGTAAPSLAASGGPSQTNDLAVWIFIGFCALIIAAQIIPLILDAGKKSAKSIESAKAAEQKQAH